MKYIIVTGGVVSGLGKGITISSIGRILKSSGVAITSIKIDPYLNVDAGTMSPYEHGETFVLDDGSETDLDLGNYERFLDISLSGRHNITTGKVYKEVIYQERRGDYLGKTVQIVPHTTDKIQEWIEEIAQKPVDGSGKTPEVCLIEVGGTVGDIESAVFLEALRQFQFRVGRTNTLFVHVSLVPVLGSVGEQKTKPTQHSVKELRSLGLSPDVVVCRSSCELEESTRKKLGIFCQVDPGNTLSVHDVSNIYHVPLILVNQGLHTIIKNTLQLTHMTSEPDLKAWTAMARGVDNVTETVSIALVGKYTELSDAYLSVTKALIHSGIHLQVKVEIRWVEAQHLELPTSVSGVKSSTTASASTSTLDGLMDSPSTNTNTSTNTTNTNGKKGHTGHTQEQYDTAWSVLQSSSGVLVPGGFGNRGVEGKIAAAKYCRESGKPYLGVCLGMQVMVIEYVRHILGKSDANSEEFDKDADTKAIIFMPEIDSTTMGGNMRLGARATTITAEWPTSGVASGKKGGSTGSDIESTNTSTNPNPTTNTTPTLASLIYSVQSTIHKSLESEQSQKQWILERHRHRYEVNPKLINDIESHGLLFSGKDIEGERMEIAELHTDSHPFYFGTQFHPEFKSRPNRPSPPFFAFIVAAMRSSHGHGSGSTSTSNGKNKSKGVKKETTEGKEGKESNENNSKSKRGLLELSEAGKLFQEHEKSTSPYKKAKRTFIDLI